MATFRDIVAKQREKGEGIGSSLATAFSERARERLDPRNYLFKKKGLLTALLPGLKGYQAKTGEKLKGGESGGMGAGAEAILNTIADRLGELKTQFRMVAKNSIVLPQMARDTNLTRQNIQKLVKMQGGEASNKADMFFKRAGDRESQYESAMKAGKPTPNKKEEKKEDKSFFRKMLEFIIGTVGTLFKSLIAVIPDLVGGLKKLLGVIGGILSIATNFGLLKMAGRVLPSLGKGLLAVGAGAATAMGLRKSLPAAIPNAEMEGKTLTSRGTVGDKVKAGQLAAEKERELATKAEKSLAGKAATEGAKKGLWGRFLAYVQRKSPQLFARIGRKLAVAAALMTIPILGWVAAAIDIGFTLWTAYELYVLWKEFTDEEESESLPNNPPLLDKSKYDDPPTPIEDFAPLEAGNPARAPQELGYGPGFKAPVTKSDYEEIARKKANRPQRLAQRQSAVTPENAAATNSLTSKMKKGDTSAYAHAPGTDILAQKIMSSVPEFGQFTGFNDEFHNEKHKNSQHTKGLAIDFVTRGGAKTQGAAVKNIEKIMADAGLKPSDYLVKSEILGVTPHATGDHVHVQFQNEAAAEAFRTHATNAAMIPSAYAAIPGQKPTQAVAPPAAPPAARSTPAVAAVIPKSVKLAGASQTNMDLARQSNAGGVNPVVNNVVNNNNSGGGGGPTFVASANLYDKDLVDLFMDSLGTA